MQDSFKNSTNSSRNVSCVCGPSEKVLLTLTDVSTFLMGQPVIVKLLWITFTSAKTPDILNVNSAVFHNFQYLISVVHVIVLFALPPVHKDLLTFMFVYAQLGGPANLAFICMQRYVAVVHPTLYPLLNKYRIREACAVTVWLLSLPLAFASVFAGDTFPSGTEGIIKSFPFYVTVFMVGMTVRGTIRIMKTLKKSSPGNDKLHPAKKRAFKTIRATSIITLCFYVPVTVFERFLFLGECVNGCLITPVCILLLSAASVVHPLFYLSTQGKLPCLK